jgi:5-methylcytosine-specific restriction protein B
VYLDRPFLDEIVSLLREKQQVIFYGPPGTGKTYVAQKLAEAVAPDQEQRMLVQFHPSTTYEDFFEGYRPEPSASGGLTYRLVPGPLRLLADAAEADPDRTYVLIVDEINRANLPKVFGELLFLLEYRDRSARLLYRPETEFSLPPNLWIIGTMNTADRSIALVDTALRRRFNFVPFIPDVAGRNAVSQVLRKWVEKNEELETLPDIVDRVNNQLRAELAGDHLLLGPSYFMHPDIDEARLQRVWEYQIEPLIEDLFFGEPERAARFRFDRVWAELGAPAVEAEEEAAAESEAEPVGGDATATDAAAESR